MDSTLLLNASYQPIKVISWKKAVSLFFLDKVEVVENYKSDVRSVSVSIKMPAVVRLVRYVNIKRLKPTLSKENLLARDNYSCQYCNIKLEHKASTIDHVIPRSQQGDSSWQNIVIACSSCNRKKGGRTPEQANMKLKKKPICPNWLPVVNINIHKSLPGCWLLFLDEKEKKSLHRRAFSVIENH